MGHHHTNLLSSPETSLWSSTNPSLCFLSVDSVVTSSTTSLSTEALERSPARSSQRVGVLDHRIDVLLLAPVLRLKREWSLALTCASACCWLCSFIAYALFLPAVGFALVLPAVGFALVASFLRHHPNCPFYPNCWLQLELCSLHVVAASLHAIRCASTLFHVLRV